MSGGIEPAILNTIVQGDCIDSLSKLPDGCIDLVFADPPFNIGFEYDVYKDKKGTAEYLGWTRKWIEQVYRVLKSSGTFWLAIGDEYAAEMKVLSQEIGFTTRSWVIWYYTFGVNCTHKFTRSHAHLFYFVKNPDEFTFREGELENRVPSARQLVYNDSRANPKGRLPDDTWILRPQDLVDCFTPGEDTWYFPRVAGTFTERAGFHGCQMPEQLLGRIIRACSNPGDLVADPFSGSATTLAVAKKLGRNFLGFELSPEYVKRGTARTNSARPGDPLDGAAEPLMSAPATMDSTRNKSNRDKPKKKNGTSLFPEENTPDDEAGNIDERLIQAFQSVYDGYSLDRVLADPNFSSTLIGKCRELGLPGSPKDWNHSLLRLRKSGKLEAVTTLKRTEFSWAEYDEFWFASEIAWSKLHDQGTLDDILCDPVLANQFDEIATQLAPGFLPFQYRWGAITLRKNSKTAHARSEFFTDVSLEQFSSKRELKSWDEGDDLSDVSGLYLISGRSKKNITYVGWTLDLQNRLFLQFGDDRLANWEKEKDAKEIWFLEKSEVADPIDLLSMQQRLIQLTRPRLNDLGPAVA